MANTSIPEEPAINPVILTLELSRLLSLEIFELVTLFLCFRESVSDDNTALRYMHIEKYSAKILFHL